MKLNKNNLFSGLLKASALTLALGVSLNNAQALDINDYACPVYSPEQVKELAPDMEKIRRSLIDSWTGKVSQAEVNSLLNELIDPALTTVNEKGEKVPHNGNRLDFDNRANIYQTYRKLQTLVKAYAENKDPFLLAVVLTTIETLEKKYFYWGAPEIGNWWWYEIGGSKFLGQLVVMLSDYIPLELQKKLVKPTEYFQPNPYLSAVAPGAVYSSSPNLRISTGGNRLDTALVSFYRGVVNRDPSQIQCALNSINDTVSIVDHGDGFHTDGTFIQHENTGYNGTYGAVLLDGFAIMKNHSKDTSFQFGNQEVYDLFNSFKDSYGYLIINGAITDAVSGRAIYKYNPSYGRDNDPLKTLYHRRYSSSDYNRGKNILNILKELDITFPEKTDNKYFYAMDRLVHRNKNKGAIVLAMHSSRIANYETMNGDNPYGQNIGDGQTYIYGLNPYAFTSYTLDYNPNFVPGTTEIDYEVTPYRGERRKGNDTADYDFVGGVSLSNNSQFVGFEYSDANNRLHAFKSFIADDKGLFASGYAYRWFEPKIYTTIDQRRLDPYMVTNTNEPTAFDKYKAKGLSDEEAHHRANVDVAKANPNPKPQVWIDGKAVTKNTHYDVAPKTIEFKDKTGTHITYKLWDMPNLDVVFENGFVRFVSYNTDKYAYSVYPQTKAPKEAPYQVVKADNNEQILLNPKNGTLYMNFFSPGPHKYAGIEVDDRIQVVKSMDKKGNLVLDLNDPTQMMLLATEIEVDGAYELISTTANVEAVKTTSKKTSFYVNLNTEGKSVRVVLKPVKY